MADEVCGCVVVVKVEMPTGVAVVDMVMDMGQVMCDEVVDKLGFLSLERGLRE